jgi:hypothetical protein
MKAKKKDPRDYVQGGRDLADGVWETQGPDGGAFLREPYDFANLPAGAMEDLEEDLGRPFTAEERKRMEEGYRERLAELLEELISGASGILGKVRRGRR